MKQSKAKQYSFTLHMWLYIHVVTKWPLQWTLRWSILGLVYMSSSSWLLDHVIFCKLKENLGPFCVRGVSCLAFCRAAYLLRQVPDCNIAFPLPAIFPINTPFNKTSSLTLQIYTAGNGTHVKNVKVTSICRRYYNVEV